MMETQNRNYSVYKHETPNGKIYIGITSQIPERRWANGKGYQHNAYFDGAIKKYGWNNIEHSILFSGLTKQEAEEKERMLIAFFHSNERKHGYNITSGGECIGKHSMESRRKMSEAKKGCPSARKGCHLSEETKIKLREKHIGRRYNLGVPLTDERKKNISEALKRNGSRKGEKNPNFGKKWTPEQIAVRQAHRIYTCGSDNPNAKSILQYSLDGKLIKVWGSVIEAKKAYGDSIKKCLNGSFKQSHGFIWRYKENENGKT